MKKGKAVKLCLVHRRKHFSVRIGYNINTDFEGQMLACLPPVG